MSKIKEIGEKRKTPFNPRDPRKVLKYSGLMFVMIRFMFSSKE